VRIPQTTITDRLHRCYELVEKAEIFAHDGFYEDSNATWAKAAEIAVSLIKEYNAATFTDNEYKFLKSIINHITEED
jgi:hypothetical protein